jgi:bifunctional non-homologous end joining protein LigD
VSLFAPWRVPLPMKARAPKLGFIEPMLPRLVLKPPTGREWLHELKYDGWRVQAHKSKRGVQLFTRRGHDRRRCAPTAF